MSIPTPRRPASAPIIFEETGDFGLVSEPIVFVSCGLFETGAISTVFMEVPLARCARAYVESCSMRSSICSVAEPVTVAEPATVAEPLTVTEPLTAADPLTVAGSLTVLDALEHMFASCSITLDHFRAVLNATNMMGQLINEY